MDPNPSQGNTVGAHGEAVASFVAGWSDGRRARIETFLGEAEESGRGTLIEQLLAREIDLRETRGDRPVVGDYLGRFPGFRAQVERVFETRVPPGGSTGSFAGVGATSSVDSNGENPTASRLSLGSTGASDPVPSTSRAASSWEQLPSAQTSFGPYRVVRVLGQGGMGVVFQARHEQTGLEVALKTVRVRRQALLHRIRREIHSLTQIRHPGLVKIIETGHQVDGQPWYAMESIQGSTLGSFLKQAHAGSLPAETMEPEGLITPAETAASGRADQIRADPDGPDPVTASHLPGAIGLPEFEVAPAGPSAAGDATDGVDPSRPPRPFADHADFLRVVVRLCRTLAYLHGEGIVHRDLKPDNVILRGDDTPVLIDFGLASRSDAQGREVLEVGGRVEGTPAYMSPEQIRGELVDARTDLYAVGCMLYEGVTGRIPFRRPSSASTLLAHVGDPAIPPRTFAPEIPKGLEDLILRLLAKSARERLGYAHDVVSSLARLGVDDGGWAADLVPRDYLYRPGFVGREAFLGQLEGQILGAIAGPGRCVFVRGQSGVGKTRLLMELTGRLERRGLTVVVGECLPVETGGPSDGLAVRAMPFHPFRPLLQAVADACVEYGPAEVESLLAPGAEVLAACEPSLASLRPQGGRDDPGQRSNDDIRLRLMDALAETLKRFAARNPLVLPLDDIQWADELTLDFLQLYQRGTWTIPGLAIVGLYRAEEEPPMLRADAAGFRGAARLDLGSIAADGLREIVGDILGSRQPDQQFVRHLTEISEGNPFFVGEYLRACVAERLLTRGDGERWVLKVPGAAGAEIDVEALPLPGSLRGLIARRLDGLAEPDRRLVELLAVVGRETEAELLAADALRTEDDVMGGLERLIAAQLIEESCADVFRFVHDKLREVAYAQIPADRRRELHRQVALALEEKYATRDDFARRYPVLAHHWHRSIGDRREHADRVPKALDYLEKSLHQAVAAGLSREAVEYGLAMARLLDVHLPSEPADVIEAIGKQIARVNSLMGGRSPADLLDLPLSDDPELARTVGLLQAIHPPAHLSNQLELSALAAATNLALMLERGRTVLSPVVYALYSTVVRNLLGDSRLADQFIQVAAEMDERQGGHFRAAVSMIRSWFINHWVRPLREGIAMSRAGAKAGFASGDQLFACYCVATYVVLTAEVGSTLDRVIAVAREGVERINRRVLVAHFHCVLEGQFAKALAAQTNGPTSLTDDEVDENRDLASICRTTNSNQIGFYHTYKLRLHYYRGQAAEAVGFADQAWEVVKSFMGQTAEVELTFYHALALLELAGAADDPSNDPRLERARTFARSLARWADECEVNFRHRAQVVEAEIARVEGRHADAFRSFDLAVQGALAGDGVQHAALARELAGRHHSRMGNPDAARASFAEAARCYRQWGATSKVDEIERLIGRTGPA